MPKVLIALLIPKDNLDCPDKGIVSIPNPRSPSSTPQLVVFGPDSLKRSYPERAMRLLWFVIPCCLSVEIDPIALRCWARSGYLMSNKMTGGRRDAFDGAVELLLLLLLQTGWWWGSVRGEAATTKTQQMFRKAGKTYTSLLVDFGCWGVAQQVHSVLGPYREIW